MRSNFTKLTLLIALSLNLGASGYEVPKKQKGLLELKTKDTILTVGGRIELDSYTSWPQGSHFAKAIPIGKQAGEDGQTIMTSKDSRLWVKTRTPSKYGMVRALIETDFNGVKGTQTNTNSQGLRLRHAYVQVGGWSIGQTNSAFNADVNLDILLTAINDTFVRQQLIRYQYEDNLFSYAISFEQPETTLLDSNANIITPEDDIIPDIISRIIYYPKWGEIALSLMGRYITQDHAKLSDGTILNNKDSAFGWGGNLCAKVKIFKLDDIRAAAHYGNGMGRYLAYDAYPAGLVTPDGEIKLQTSFGGHIGYRHWWNHKLRSTISYSYAATKNDTTNLNNLDKVNKDAQSSQVNLLWMPIPNSLVGVEYALAKRGVESGKEGKIKMLNLIFRYDF